MAKYIWRPSIFVPFRLHVEHGGGQPAGADCRIGWSHGSDPCGAIDRFLLFAGNESAGEHAAECADAFAGLGADARSDDLRNADLADRPGRDGGGGYSVGAVVEPAKSGR